MTAMFSTDPDFLRTAVVCATLGVPQDDWVLFWRWADGLAENKALDELNSYVDVLVAARCFRPADDAVSRLIALDWTDDEIRRHVAALVAKPEDERSRGPVTVRGRGDTAA
ncbi:hypothetical protein [Mycolicibacterium sphagni]|uniref:Uncharacterized protein n=1 Tax=Mycolicibacterium sphagni TaxID=1786 RepID=A0ABX2JQD6_9MYCO|nr:hypothetical protein [Mycolicibacterium sphagni]NTY58788.1 hypothetical protein [Mycolicibacterium sphagni]